MAIGQLADYRRFIGDGGPRHLAVLLPSVPREDPRELLRSEGIEIIHPDGSGFTDTTGGSLV